MEVCSSSEQIEEFCRQTCIKLECCPLLFSPYQVKEPCPENCWQLTKTKYSQSPSQRRISLVHKSFCTLAFLCYSYALLL